MAIFWKLSQKGLTSVFIILFLILGPFSITQWNKVNILIVFVIASITLILVFLMGRKLKFWPVSFYPSLIYIFSFIVSLYSLVLTRESLTGEYVNSVIFGRLFTFVTILLTVLLINLWLAQAEDKDLLKSLKIGFSIGLIFILLGYWQFIGNIMGIPFFIETRDWMHGVPIAIQSIVPRRLTSIAEEPNYLSPLLIEYLILTGLVIAKKIIKYLAYGLGLFVVIFSFSGGAYVNLLLVLSFYGFISLYRSFIFGKLKAQDLVFLFLIILFFCVILSIGDILIDFIFAKLQGEAAGQSARSQFLSSLVQLISDSSLSQLLFGHGMATMSVLTDFGLPNEEFLFRITNNFYLDMIWEGGALGLSCIIIFFGYLLLVGFSNYLSNKYYEAGLLLTVHMMITCLYRSEYLSPHFIWVMTLIFICYKKGSCDMQRQFSFPLIKISPFSVDLRAKK